MPYCISEAHITDGSEAATDVTTLMAALDVHREMVASVWRVYLLMTCPKYRANVSRRLALLSLVLVASILLIPSRKSSWFMLRFTQARVKDTDLWGCDMMWIQMRQSLWQRRALLTADIQGCSARDFQTTQIENPKLFQLYQKHIFEIVLCFIMGSTEEPLSGKNPN